MGSYTFGQRCRPRGNFRINEIIEFFYLMKEAFRFPVLYDGNSRQVEISASNLQRIFAKQIDKRFPGIGVGVAFFNIPPRNKDENTVRFEIHTGTHTDEIFIDSYNISIGENRKVPDFDYFEKSIQIFKPFEAYVSEFKNESRINAYDREQAIPKWDRPAVIRGFHYLDEGMARAIGGINHCLKAPAWHVERFCDGVLIELVPSLFDNDNPEHLRVQEEVMDYFGLL